MQSFEQLGQKVLAGEDRVVLRRSAGEAGVAKMSEFCNELGAPVPGVGVAEMPEFRNTEPTGAATQVAAEPVRQTAAAEVLGADEGKRRGRPTSLTPELKERVRTLVSVGFSRRQAAVYVDVAPSTITREAARDPEFADDLRMADEQSTLEPMLKIISESRKNWRAAVWFLKHKAKQPVALTEEEKELRHQEDIKSARRSREVSDAFLYPPTTPRPPQGAVVFEHPPQKPRKARRAK